MSIRQPVTITQVAESAGVSIATVSRVLNRRGQVDEHTRKRVMNSVESLGYDAGAIARKRTAPESKEVKSYNVELLLCPLAEQKDMLRLDFIADILRGIQSYFSRRENVRTNLSTWEADESLHHEENELTYNRLINADGILIIGNPSAAITNRLIAAGASPVLISTDRQDIPVNSVCSDDFAGGVMAANHLIGRGFRKIGFLTGSDKICSFQMRRNGVMVTVANALGSEAFETRTSRTSDVEDVAVCVREWLDSGHFPEAVITSHAAAANVICKVLAERNLRCPDDVGIITFDSATPSENPFGIQLAQLITYPRELGNRSAQRVYHIMTGSRHDDRPYKIIIPLELTPGESVKQK